MNPLVLLQIKNAWDRFQQNHPKFPMFLKAVSQDAIAEGTILEITVTTADGKAYKSNLKLNEDDLNLIRQFQDLSQNS